MLGCYGDPDFWIVSTMASVLDALVVLGAGGLARIQIRNSIVFRYRWLHFCCHCDRDLLLIRWFVLRPSCWPSLWSKYWSWSLVNLNHSPRQTWSWGFGPQVSMKPPWNDHPRRQRNQGVPSCDTPCHFQFFRFCDKARRVTGVALRGNGRSAEDRQSVAIAVRRPGHECACREASGDAYGSADCPEAPANPFFVTFRSLLLSILSILSPCCLSLKMSVVFCQASGGATGPERGPKCPSSCAEAGACASCADSWECKIALYLCIYIYIDVTTGSLRTLQICLSRNSPNVTFVTF